jgi:hypothetical protein
MRSQSNLNRRAQSQSKSARKHCCLDELMHRAVEYNRGHLILNKYEYSQLIALLEAQALRCLAPGDKMRLDGVTLLKNLDGTASVEMRILRIL